LMPYIYSLAGSVYLNDYTIMRPLVMDFGADKNVLNIGDQYMFGPDLMVCPVYQYKAREREVYFPEGAGWYSVYSGQFTGGGIKVKVKAPYDRMPVYAAAGSILPMGDVIQNTKENQIDLTIFVYAGKDGKFTLYEDEGVNYNYEKGAYSTIPFTYNDKDKTLTIGKRAGEFAGMNRERIFRVVYVTPEKPVGIDAPQINTTISYNREEQTVHL